jgi:hypothetical protein
VRWWASSAGTAIALAVGAVALVFTAGLFFFRRMERTFADVV